MINKANSLYIHIPFCDHICKYCDFAKVEANLGFEKQYLESLFIELESYHIEKHSLKTIYIGGGTPTALSYVELETLLKKVEPLLDTNSDYEFTIETNVERINQPLIDLLNKYHVNRISIGVQSFDDNILKFLGRTHSSLEAINAIKLLKDNDFPNINVDLIYGFKGIDEKILKKELETYLSLNVEHISTYSLILEDHTVFNNVGIEEMDDADVRKQYDLILSILRKHGYNRYEVSNFAKPGYESKHNITYWKDEHYYGVGLGAAAYLDKTRYSNTRNIKSYIEHKYVASKEEISFEDDQNYFLMLNLRLEKGFSYKEYEKKFFRSFKDEFADSINKLTKDGLLVVEENGIKCTDNGIMLLDIILRELFK